MKRPRDERNRIFLKNFKMLSGIPFYFGVASFPKIFIAYHPDSYADFNVHPEFSFLFKSFIAHNKFNNAGDIARLWSFIINIEQILSEDIKGDFAELGVWRGNTASVLAYFASRNARTVDLFDTFEGFDKRDIQGIDTEKRIEFSDTSVNLVKNVIGDSHSVCNFVKGYFPESISDVHRNKIYAIVSLDCDLYEPMKAGLNFFYPLMPEGGLFLLHDYSNFYWDGSKKAIDEFCKANHEYVVLMPDKSGSAFIRKSK